MKRLKNPAVIFISGLVFSAVFAVITFAAALAARLSGYNNIFILALGIIPSAPVYAGHVAVARNILAESERKNAARLFLEAVKQKWKIFLLFGIAAYLVCAASFFAVLYYTELSRDNFVYAIALVAYSVFALVLLTALLHFPLIACSYELKFRTAAKQSFKIAFANIGRSLLALLCAAVPLGAAIAGIWLAHGVPRLVIAAAAVVILPTLITAAAVKILSPSVQKALGSFSPAPPEPEVIQNIDEIAAGSDSDYIFINGKMVKNPNRQGK